MVAKKISGAAYGNLGEFDQVDLQKFPEDAHVRLAKSTGKEIFRRPYSYTDHVDPTTGQAQDGLLFLSFQKNPQASFLPMLQLLSKKDALNEYTQHIGSALFACPHGIKPGDYLAHDLFL